MNFPKIKNDKIVVVDVESTCWDTRAGEHPPRIGSGHSERSEIIEIGICLLDVKTGKRSNKRSIIVRPTMSTVSKFCTELTGHTQENLEEYGVAFSTACRFIMEDYDSLERTWASYGIYDLDMFRKQCVHDAFYPFSKHHINVKKIAALAQKRSGDTGMKKCLTKWYNLSMKGRHHNGADDAWNIAAILGSAMRFNMDRGILIHDYEKEEFPISDSTT